MASPQFLVCTNAPSSELALLNSVHVNPQDARSPYVNIGNFVYRAAPNSDVDRNHIAMNAIQRRMAHALPGANVEVSDFLVPVTRDFTVKAVTIEAQFVKPSQTRSMRVLLFDLPNTIRSQLLGDVITFGQSIVINYMDSNILLWVKSNVRGLVTSQTEIGLVWVGDNTM
jgi:hypothetical protein